MRTEAAELWKSMKGSQQTKNFVRCGRPSNSTQTQLVVVVVVAVVIWRRSFGVVPRPNFFCNKLKRLFGFLGEISALKFSKPGFANTNLHELDAVQFSQVRRHADLVFPCAIPGAQSMGCDTRLQAEAFKVKGALLSSVGMIGIIIQSFALSGNRQPTPPNPCPKSEKKKEKLNL